MANHFVDRVEMEPSAKSMRFCKESPRSAGPRCVTIIDVQMLGDLSMARVYYTIMSDLGIR